MAYTDFWTPILGATGLSQFTQDAITGSDLAALIPLNANGALITITAAALQVNKDQVIKWNETGQAMVAASPGMILGDGDYILLTNREQIEQFNLIAIDLDATVTIQWYKSAQ